MKPRLLFLSGGQAGRVGRYSLFNNTMTFHNRR